MENEQDIMSCCSHYKTDKYLDGYVVLPVIRVKICQNCGHIHFVCSFFWCEIFKWFIGPFWDGKVMLLALPAAIEDTEMKPTSATGLIPRVEKGSSLSRWVKYIKIQWYLLKCQSKMRKFNKIRVKTYNHLIATSTLVTRDKDLYEEIVKNNPEYAEWLAYEENWRKYMACMETFWNAFVNDQGGKNSDRG